MSDTDRDPVIDCPKCGKPMRQLEAGGITVDRCEKCHGIWLDQNERVKVLKDRALLAGLDVGPEEKGREHDAIRNIDCPRCGTPMVHVADRAQKHVGYETCRECKGSFFDAGELRDLSEFTLTERLRALFGG